MSENVKRSENIDNEAPDEEKEFTDQIKDEHVEEEAENKDLEETVERKIEDEINGIEKPVLIKAEAYKTIILYASRYANKSISPEDWKEIYGILIGYSDDEFVYVEEAEALTFGHSTDVQLDQRHYGFIQEIEDKLYEMKNNRFIVGWFHSHPGLGLFFSYIDLINQLGFQGQNNDAIGLVFDHTLLGKKKQEKVEGTAHTITKYETGFEIYRLNDVNKDVNAPDYDTNYHNVDYIIDGLNKFFFANVLSELSALVSAGKPLQSAYGEDFKLESDYRGSNSENSRPNDANSSNSKIENNNQISTDMLDQIPMDENISFDSDNFFYDYEDSNDQKEFNDKFKEAEQLLYEGNQAFKNKDIFTGVQKYRDGIKIYQELGNVDRLLEILKNLTETCISSNHLILAGEFAEKLNAIADREGYVFYRGEANYLIGYLLLKKGNNDVLQDALNKIRDAAILFEKEDDFVGAGTCFYKIGTIYELRLNKLENSCLFYREALENYNKAIIKNHPLRKSLWSKPEALKQKILELKDAIEEILPKLENNKIRNKIKKDLNSIHFNF
ncbi:MAG: hypothetical protein GF317_21690 [Candidatus Lokiarchaeota archaeon]|nr:hypothetical protein [Candidatus Lokiarchaeota archaeon]MBD3202074.1 hypothetical protein [Candidatus Lokiarchaeota archaeon]